MVQFWSRTPQNSGGYPQPSTLDPRPSTLNPQPSTLNPHPSTLNPQPSSHIPQPSALSPQPSILNPQPSTLNPHPSTLHAMPFRGGGGREEVFGNGVDMENDETGRSILKLTRWLVGSNPLTLAPQRPHPSNAQNKTPGENALHNSPTPEQKIFTKQHQVR